MVYKFESDIHLQFPIFEPLLVLSFLVVDVAVAVAVAVCDNVVDVG